MVNIERGNPGKRGKISIFEKIKEKILKKRASEGKVGEQCYVSCSLNGAATNREASRKI